MEAVKIIRIENPPVNVLSTKVREKLIEDLRNACSDDNVRAVFVTGIEGYFSAGADVKEFEEFYYNCGGDESLMLRKYAELFESNNLGTVVSAIESSPIPIIAIISGLAHGGGLEIALACHYRVCTPQSSFRFPETMLGILPGALGTQMLPRLISFEWSLRMCVDNIEIKGDEALSIGLVDQVIVPLNVNKHAQYLNELVNRMMIVIKDHLIATKGRLHPSPFRKTLSLPVMISASDARRLCDTYKSKLRMKQVVDGQIIEYYKGGNEARKGAIDALLACVQCYQTSIQQVLSLDKSKVYMEGAVIETEINKQLFISKEAHALRYVFLAEKAVSHVPSVSKRFGDSISSASSNIYYSLSDIRYVGIIGSGVMGSGIAINFLLNGYLLLLYDVSNDNLKKAMDTIKHILMGYVLKGRISTEQARILGTNILPTTDILDFAGCQVVLEAIFENLLLKQELFIKLEQICTPNTIFCTNTSSLSIESIASICKYKHRVIGLHFFSPAHVMKLVEVIITSDTSMDIMQTMMMLTKKIKKVGVLIHDRKNCSGFVGNRMIFPYILESMLLIEEYAPQLSIERIDFIIKKFGFLMGPFEMQDLSGLDIGYSIRKEFGFVNSRKDANVVKSSSVKPVELHRYSKIGDELYKMGRLGVKTKTGYYNYANPRGKVVDTEVVEMIMRCANEKRCDSKCVPNNAVTTVSTNNLKQLTSQRVSDELILHRLLFPIMNEGFKILEDLIIVSNRPSDIDIIYIYGYSWPAYTGGPMFYADRYIGLSKLLNKLTDYYDQYHATYYQPSRLLQYMVYNNISMLDIQRYPELLNNIVQSLTTQDTVTSKSKL